MSEGGFTSWKDTQLRTFVQKLVNVGEEIEKQEPTSILSGFDVHTAHNTQITCLYTKTVIIQLERLCKKIDELNQSINRLSNR